MIRVLIVDDQELFRESLKVVLSVSPGVEVVGAASGVQEALKAAASPRRLSSRYNNSKLLK